MVTITDVTSERKEFIKRICEVKKIDIPNTTITSKNYFTDKDDFVSYKDWIGENYDPTLKVHTSGMLKVENGELYVLLPTLNELGWYSKAAMDPNCVLVKESKPNSHTALYGTSGGNRGYFSTADRELLYSIEWKKVEVTMAEIAKKFKIPVERLKIKP